MNCPECDSNKNVSLAPDSKENEFINQVHQWQNEDELKDVSEIQPFTRLCSDCGYFWNENETEIKSADDFVKKFCKMAMVALEMHNKRIEYNLLNTRFQKFYRNDHKGLSLFGVCERDIQHIIVTELYRFFPIWPEYVGAYTNKQRLDVGLLFEAKPDENGDSEPDIAIELKWAGFKKDGQLAQYAQQALVDDVVKMKRNCIVKNKYFMQFSITDFSLGLRDGKAKQNLENDVNSRIDRRQIKNHSLALQYYDYFTTLGKTAENRLYFNMVLWKIVPNSDV